jgi:uncharacterized cupredoxin-like copper-binding protein
MLRSIRSGRIALVGALVAAACLTALAGPALASKSKAQAAVTVTATEFKFKVAPAKVAHGTVTFTVTNKGKLPHDFKIAGKKTPQLKPGKSAKLTVTLKAGKYPYLCTVPGHAAAGMKGTLTVS